MKFFKKGEHYQFIICEKEIIARTGDEKQLPYLVRFTFLRTPWFQILFHKFLISDDDCLHDHPWPFITCLLRGGYYEWSVLKEQTPPVDMGNVVAVKVGYDGHLHVKRKYKAGSILYRPATYKHRVELIQGTPAYSMVLTTKPVRPWGFWSKTGFVPRKEHHAGIRCD